MIPVRITNHVEQGLARLLFQYKGKVDFETFFSIFLARYQILEDAIWEVIEKRNIEGGEGAQLNAIGRIVKRPRGGLDDDDYKIAIKAEIAILRSIGRADEIIDVGLLCIPDGFTFNLHDEGNATLYVDVNETVDFTPQVFLRAIARVKSGGVRLVLHYRTHDTSEDFIFGDTSEDIGFGSVYDADMGGRMIAAQEGFA